ncbi:MAG: anti-sigma factor family protein [Candidatus Limnocylindria bacterium]
MPDRNRPIRDDLQCVELVDSLTDYLDGDLKRRRVEQHLATCEGCRAALDQFQTTIGVAGRLTPDDVAHIDALVRDRLIATLGVMRRR